MTLHLTQCCSLKETPHLHFILSPPSFIHRPQLICIAPNRTELPWRKSATGIMPMAWSQPSPGWKVGLESRNKAQSIGNWKLQTNTHRYELLETVYYLLHKMDLLKGHERRLCHLQINLYCRSRTSDCPWAPGRLEQKTTA